MPYILSRPETADELDETMHRQLQEYKGGCERAYEQVKRMRDQGYKYLGEDNEGIINLTWKDGDKAYIVRTSGVVELVELCTPYIFSQFIIDFKNPHPSVMSKFSTPVLNKARYYFFCPKLKCPLAMKGNMYRSTYTSLDFKEP